MSRAFALAGVLGTCARWAHGEPVPPLVVVVTSRPEAPFVRRLAAELALFGYRVEVQARVPGDADLFELLKRSSGAALISVDQGGQTAEIVVGESNAPGPPSRERERIDPRRGADTNAAVLAERFRARLTELGIAPNGSADTVEPPAPALPAPRPAREPDLRWWIATGLGANAGGLGMKPHAELELRAFPATFLSVSALGDVGLAAANVASTEGRAEVRLRSGGVLVDVHFWRRESLSLRAGIGGQMMIASMSGYASGEHFSGRKDAVLVPAVLFESGAALRLTRRVSAELRGYVGACTPRIGVRFAGRTVADYGHPFVGASLGVAVGVF